MNPDILHGAGLALHAVIPGLVMFWLNGIIEEQDFFG